MHEKDMAKGRGETPMWSVPGYQSTVDLYGGVRLNEFSSRGGGLSRLTREVAGDQWKLVDGVNSHSTEFSTIGDLVYVKTSSPTIIASWTRTYGNLTGVTVRVVDVVREAFAHGVDVETDLTYLTGQLLDGEDKAITLVIHEGEPYLYLTDISGAQFKLNKVGEDEFGPDSIGSLPGRPAYIWSYSAEGMMGYVNLDIYADRVEFGYMSADGESQRLMVVPREVSEIARFDRLITRRLPTETELIELMEQLFPKP